ncbi:hypothetical protein Pla52n_68730 [Stieleria varia]|uniref:Uncharacterized protein n=1 Tax=Stieleria varia TaxID=2528005 RepID=A0A5C5ZP62_9BACT|nr:hypothetical protein Pla52n_68730 [Stieleria varia]
MAGIKRVDIRRQSAAAVAPQAVAAAKSEHGVAADAAIKSIASVGANQNVVPAVAVKDTNEIVGSIRERRQVNRVQSVNFGDRTGLHRQFGIKTDGVVARQTGDAELFDQQVPGLGIQHGDGNREAVV